MKNRNVLIIAAAFLLITFANSCKKDKIDIDIDLLRSTTWELYEVVFRNIETGAESNASDLFLNEVCDTSHFTFYVNGTCTEKYCHSTTYNYSYDEKGNILAINHEDGRNMYYFRIDELTANKLKFVFMHYENGDTAEEAGMAWYYKPE